MATPLPPPRWFHTSVLHNSTVYVVGGRSLEGVPRRDRWALDLLSRVWTPLPPLQHALSGHSTVLHQHWLITCFGASEQGLTNACSLFDTVHLKTVRPLLRADAHHGQPAPRHHASMLLIPHPSAYCLVYGGETDRHAMDDLWQLDVTDAPHLAWKAIARPLVPRSGHTGVVVDDATVMYYGGQSNTTAADPFFLSLSSLSSAHPRAMAMALASAEDSPSPTPISTETVIGIVIGSIVFAV
ncbi:hypothetical protein BDF14DRAFT_1727441, partial [Spinellus fusiger]